MNNDVSFLELKAKKIRYLAAYTIASLGVGHLGGSMSIIETLAVLYHKQMRIDPADPKKEGRDRLIVSKGHAGPAVYAALASKGFFPEEMLTTLNRLNTRLPSHCDRNLTPGIDMTTGSLGQGLSAAVGNALGSRMKKDGAYIYCIVGDGEADEGQIWEAAMSASSFHLDNLILFIDFNGMQVDGTVPEVMPLEPLEDKFTAFGFHAQRIDGHDVAAIDEAIEKAKAAKGKPSVIILNTVKGKGIPLAEEKGVLNHNMPFTMEQFKECFGEWKEDENNA